MSAWEDNPETGIGYAYVTSQMGPTLTGDPRAAALEQALRSALRTSPAGTRAAA